ncbi:hypothetical protein Tco_0012160 [Tanacetum coccineum]
MNMALALMAKAFKLNYSTPTNNNQRISSNPRNRQIAQPGKKYRVKQTDAECAVHNFGKQVVPRCIFQKQGVQNIGNQNGQIVVQKLGMEMLSSARAE